MVKLEYFDLLSSEPIFVAGIGTFRTPKLKEIRKLGYRKYNEFLNLISIDLEDYVKINKFESEYQKLGDDEKSKIDLFTQLISNEIERKALYNALSFFILDKIVFDKLNYRFVIGKTGVINKDNYDIVRKIILQINHCGEVNELDGVKCTNEKAKEILEKFKKAKQKIASDIKDDNLTIPNIISAFSSKSRNYNILNIWDLTIYQLFDQFCRERNNVYFDIMAMNYAYYGGEFNPDNWYTKIE